MEFGIDFKDPQGIAILSFVVGIIIWGVYTKYIPKKVNAIFIAFILIGYLLFSTYLLYKGLLPLALWLAIPIDAAIIYILFWIFIKDNGVNRKLLD